MFGHRFFGSSYYGPSYFGPDNADDSGSGGGVPGDSGTNNAVSGISAVTSGGNVSAEDI